MEAPPDPKVTAVVTDYTITLKDTRQTAISGPVMTLPVKAGTKPDEGTKNGDEEDKKKEKEEVGLLILDKERAKLEADPFETRDI